MTWHGETLSDNWNAEWLSLDDTAANNNDTIHIPPFNGTTLPEGDEITVWGLPEFEKPTKKKRKSKWLEKKMKRYKE